MAEATGGTAYQWPMAVRFVGKRDRTYIAFGDKLCHPAIVCFDHGTKKWSKPVRIGKTGVTDDSHGLPAIAIDAEGVLYWFHRGWGLRTSPDGGKTWSDLHWVFKGEKWNGGEVREFESTDGGRIWRHSCDITQNSPAPNAFPRPVENASPELQIIWCSGHKGEPGKLHAWGEAGTLFDNPDPGIRE